MYSDSSSCTFKRNISDQSYSLKNPQVHVWILLRGLIQFVPSFAPPQHFYSCRCCWVKLAFVQPSPLCASVSLLNALMNVAELSPQDKKGTSEKNKKQIQKTLRLQLVTCLRCLKAPSQNKQTNRVATLQNKMWWTAACGQKATTRNPVICLRERHTRWPTGDEMKPASVFFFFSPPLLWTHLSYGRNAGGKRPQLSPDGLPVVFVLITAIWWRNSCLTLVSITLAVCCW